jgi:GH15 family glucan-1,4-alpha-glucosidase
VSSLDLALIGNCSFGALLDARGRIVWSCLPGFDDDPVFCALLQNHDEPRSGFYDIELIGCARAEQSYRRNSAVLLTTLTAEDGSQIEITDFAPRFKQYDRTFRPTTLVRHVRPRAGNPRIRVRLRPVCDYGANEPETTRGTNHIRYVMSDMTLRLTANVPLTYILEETVFNLDEPKTLILGPDESLVQPVAATGRDFYEKTNHYWNEWCRYLALPFEWQEAVIRAAITLKLCHFEESGAIIAAMTTSIPEAATMTTSIPEAANSGRNWDYRFCWLRDSYFVVHALNRLGATRTMEGYLSYISNIVATAVDGRLQPVFGISLQHTLDEREVDTLEGYRGMGPVRVGNHAYKQIQNDGYGSVVLASAQSFFDLRLRRPGTVDQFNRLEYLGQSAISLWDQARRRAVGAAHPQGRAYLFEHDVLGRLRPAVTHRGAARTHRADGLLARQRGADSCRHYRAGMEQEAEEFRRHLWRRRGRCKPAVDAGARFPAAGRSAFPQNARPDRKAAAARQVHVPLQRRG